MHLTDLFIKRPVLASVISLMILCLGLRALSSLELRQFPKMQNTVISINTAYPGANAELMQSFITSPLEKAIASADGIDYLTSQSIDGLSTINANIRLNYDANVAMTDIMAKVAQVSNQLPKESKQPVILKQTGSQFALLYLNYSSGQMTVEQITDYLMRVVQPKLQTVPGVASAEILGGKTYAMRIWLEPAKMAAFHLSASEVASALQKQNVQTAAGQTKGKWVLFNITAHTQLSSEAAFNALVIREQQGSIVRLKDIGHAKYGAVNDDALVKFNGQNGVFLGIKATPNANPLTVIDEVKATLPEIARNYPPVLTSKLVYDSTNYIRHALYEVKHSILEATFIVVFVIFIFMGTLRAVFIPILTIPLSLIGVCSLLLLMGYSINLLTLLAMVIAIGLVVDDAIVVVENIYRHIEGGQSPYQAAIFGAREIALPILAMTTTLAAVYAPIGFMSGLTGALFKEFAFTLAFAVILSGVIAVTLSPMLCAKWLTANMMQQKLVLSIDKLFQRFKTAYQLRLTRVLQHTRVTGVFALLILAGSILMALTTRTELAPQEDQSILFLSLTAPKYANLAYTEHYTDQLVPIFNGIPETNDFFVINGMGAVNNALAGYTLKPWNERKRTQAQILKSLQPQLGEITGLNVVAFPLPSLPGGSGGLPLQFVITSTDDATVIYQVAKRLQDAAKASGLFMYIDTDLKFQKPTLAVNIDREKAASLGISMDNIGSTLSILLGGNTLNHFNAGGQSYDVIPQVVAADRYDPDKLKEYYITTEQGKTIPLGSVVDLSYQTEANILYHFQQLNSATISALMMPGYSITEGIKYLQDKAQTILPTGFSYDYAGEARQLIQEGYTLTFTFFFALLIIYLVLAAQFESFVDPFIILISVPLSMLGALLPLHLGLATLNIYTGIGLVTLIGLISKHGILIVDFANQLQAQGFNPQEAVLKAASLRLRPILMTTVAMVLGVLPLVLASGAGSASRYSIGLVIACGMVVGTAFTLFVVPSVYLLISRNPHHKTPF